MSICGDVSFESLLIFRSSSVVMELISMKDAGVNLSTLPSLNIVEFEITD